jgi:hypothetical protein
MNAVEKVKPEIADLQQAMADAIASGDQVEIKGDTEHFIVPGLLYGRRTNVPAGATIISAVHKVPHITIALKGIATVVGEDGEKRDVFAPNVFVTPAGVQRAIYAHTEVEWLTVHACEETDVDVIEKLLTCSSMDEYKAGLLEN